MTDEQQPDEPGRELAVVPEHQPPTREVAVIDTDSWVQFAKPIFELAHRVYDTEFVPKGLRGSEPATAAAMLYGREVGLPPMTALNVTHVIEGKPGLSAEAMRAMVLAAGHEIEFMESTGATCTIRGRRRGQERWTPVTWTTDMARAAGLIGRPIWKAYPRTQLQARCTTELCRMIFPDVIHGFRSIEELEDMSGEDGSTAAAGEGGGAGTSKVTRKRATKKAAAAPDARNSRETPAALPGPPLPGEPGYDDPTEPAGEVESDDRGEATRGAEPGEGSEGPASPVSEPPESASDDAAPESSGPGGAPATSHAVSEPATPGPESGERANPRPIGRGLQRALMAQFGEYGMGEDREERLLVCSTIIGREVASTNNLTHDEAAQIMDTLARVNDRAGLNNLLDTIDQANAERAAAEHGEDES